MMKPAHCKDSLRRLTGVRLIVVNLHRLILTEQHELRILELDRSGSIAAVGLLFPTYAASPKAQAFAVRSQPTSPID
jgi:hypothetical protein